MLVSHNRRGALVPEELVATETLNEIDLPPEGAVKFQRRKISTSEVDEKPGAVGNGGSITTGGERRMLWRAFGAQLGRPNLPAGQIEGQYGVFAFRGRRQVNPPTPDDRNGCS